MATLLKLSRFEGKSTTTAAIILALVVIASYSHIVFLDQSINQSPPIRPDLLGYAKKSTIFASTYDPNPNFGVIWPDHKLATNLLLDGQAPLWNPYVAIGQPLAADTQHYIFSPLILGYLLPVQFWDVPLLIALWLAGFFTFLFLRCLGLKPLSSISGGIFYMLSGMVTWWLPSGITGVIIFTPLILYSLEKIIQNRNLKYIILASVAFSLGILGAHLESIILQFMLAGFYLFYRILHIAQSCKHKKLTDVVSSDNTIITHGPKRILSLSFLSFIGGLGLSAFFILPIYEFIENTRLDHSTSFGLGHVGPVSLLQLFVPYVLGPLHTSIFHPIESSWTNMSGYVGMTALFFSILGVLLSLKNKNDPIHKYTPLFFFTVSIFFMMKIIGVPLVNYIGYLPILNMLEFRYGGAIITFSFAVVAAFGIDLLGRMNLRTKFLILTFLLSLSPLLLSTLIFSNLTPDTKFLADVTLTDARKYIDFQIFQAITFAFMAFLLSVAASKNKSALLAIIPLILLELSIYIPIGLHPVWSAYKSIIMISSMAIITLLILKPTQYTWHIADTKRIKFCIIVCILIIAVSGGVLISDLSPFGMMKKYDAYQKDPITDFLKENLGTYRMFSFDETLGRNYPAAYEISSLGYASPFHIYSFDSFTSTFLEKRDLSVKSRDTWTLSYGPMGSITKFLENKKYFDFLGVKYILTEGYNFNTFAPGRSNMSGQYTKIESQENSTGQSFTSPYDSISKIGISLSTLGLEDTGDMILMVDSISHDEKYHRESIINKIVNQRLNEFEIKPPLTDVLNKQLYMSLRYPEAANNKLALVYTHGENQTGFNIIKNELNGTFYENGIPVVEKQMVFSITPASNKYPIAFQFHDIYINENTEAFPRAFLVNQFQVVDNGKAQDFLFKNPDLDLRKKVVLEEQLPEKLTNLLEYSLIENPAEIVSYSANKVVIHTNNKDASLLVLTDVYYPGWNAFIDGSETHIYRADGLVRAIFIPSGNHTVEFLYQPQSYFIGTIISLSTAAVLIGIFIYSKIHILKNNTRT